MIMARRRNRLDNEKLPGLGRNGLRFDRATSLSEKGETSSAGKCDNGSVWRCSPRNEPLPELDKSKTIGYRKTRLRTRTQKSYLRCLESWKDRSFSHDHRKENIRTTLRLLDSEEKLGRRRNATSKDELQAEFSETNLQRLQHSNPSITPERTKQIPETHDPDTAVHSTNQKYILKHNKKRRSLVVAKFKRLAKFLTILFGLWKKHAKRVQDFLEYNVDFLDVERPSGLLFDVTEFKTTKQARFPSDAKKILKKPAKERKPDEVKRVQVALASYQPIAEYPLVMTSLMAQRAWYERYSAKRVIIKEGHPARCYYFILSGSVVMTKMDEDSGISRTECFLGRGESFGDLAIVNKGPRESTIISRETVELLVFGDEDYTEIFMSGGLNNPEHPLFRSLYCLKGWPTELLADNPDNALLIYFKRGTILVYDSKCNDWIFIIKSGSCSVLKKLRNTKPSPCKQVKDKLQHSDRAKALVEHRHGDVLSKKLTKADEEREKKSLIYRQTRLQELNLGIELIPVGTKKWDPIEEDVNIKVNDQKTKRGRLSISGPFLTKTNMNFHPRASITPEGKQTHHGIDENKHAEQPVVPEIYIEDVPPDERRNLDIYVPRKQGDVNRQTVADRLNERYLSTGHVLNDVDRDPLFIRVRTLTKGFTFGLSDFIHNDQPSLSLVSNGAECIVIRKKFYLDQVSKELLATLKAKVTPYPSDEELQNLLQQHFDWLFNRKRLVRTIKKEHRTEKVDVHDARSVPRLND